MADFGVCRCDWDLLTQVKFKPEENFRVNYRDSHDQRDTVKESKNVSD